MTTSTDAPHLANQTSVSAPAAVASQSSAPATPAPSRADTNPFTDPSADPFATARKINISAFKRDKVGTIAGPDAELQFGAADFNAKIHGGGMSNDEVRITKHRSSRRTRI